MDLCYKDLQYILLPQGQLYCNPVIKEFQFICLTFGYVHSLHKYNKSYSVCIRFFWQHFGEMSAKLSFSTKSTKLF